MLCRLEASTRLADSGQVRKTARSFPGSEVLAGSPKKRPANSGGSLNSDRHTWIATLGSPKLSRPRRASWRLQERLHKAIKNKIIYQLNLHLLSHHISIWERERTAVLGRERGSKTMPDFQTKFNR